MHVVPVALESVIAVCNHTDALRASTIAREIELTIQRKLGSKEFVVKLDDVEHVLARAVRKHLISRTLVKDMGYRDSPWSWAYRLSRTDD